MLFPLLPDLFPKKGKRYEGIDGGQDQVENEDRKAAPPEEFNAVILHHWTDLCVLHFTFKSVEKNL